MSASSCPVSRPAFNSALTCAGVLALIFTSPAFAGGPAGRGVSRAAPVVLRAPAAVMTRHAAAPAIQHAQRVSYIQRMQPRAQARPLPSMATTRFAQQGPRIIELQRHDRQFPREYHGRFHRGQGRFVTVISGGGGPYAAASPIYAAEPVYAAQQRVEYVPVERPLQQIYGEPRLPAPQIECAAPLVRYIGRPRRSGPLPQVVYGIEPPCGHSEPAPAPAVHAPRLAPVRAAY